MRPFETTISLAEALAIVRDAAVPIDRTERVSLGRATGRVAGRDVLATRDVPPFDRAAMDGFAVRAADTRDASANAPVRLRATGTIFTGELSDRTLREGECVTIATGASLPPGADAVVIIEHTSVSAGGLVLVRASVSPGQHVSARGADMRAGDRAVTQGEVLTPARIGAIAALGIDSIDAYERPRVFLASTGNEVAALDTPLGPGQIYDVNRWTVSAVVESHGGTVIPGRTAMDSIESLRSAFDHAAAHAADLIVLSGGSSVGDRDLLVDAVRERGDVLFHGVAIKPGKPTLFARLDRTLLLGMPGNPTSCLSNAYVLLVPLLRRMARLPEWRPERRQAPLAREVINTSGRYTFFTVRLEDGRAVPAFKGSGDITSLAHADGYIEIPADVTRVDAGTLVMVTLF